MQFLNALFPILSILDISKDVEVLKTVVFNLLQSLNAFSSIELKPEEKLIFSNFLQLSKALFPIL